MKKQYVEEVWNNPHAGFCWFVHSSRDVDPVVYSHTRPCGHFTGWTKTKQKTEGGRKKQTWIQNSKTQESEVGTF